MINVLIVCTVGAVGAAVSALLGLPLGAGISLTVIGTLFTIIWLMDPFT